MEARKNNILRGITIVMSFSMIAKVLSFFIEMLTAYRIGVSIESDAYYVVYSVYTIISPMISVGIWKVYLPAYKEKCLLGNHQDANALTDQLFTIFELLAMVIVLCINLFPARVLSIFAPGFTEQSISIAKPLLRIISFLFFVGIIHTFCSAILQSHNRFEKSQLKGIIQHIPTLIYLSFFTKHMNVTGIAISIMVSETLTAVVMSIFASDAYVFHVPKRLIDKETIQVLKGVPSACANSVINQLNGVVDKSFASRLPMGSITCLNYGVKLSSFFDGIFSTAVSTAVFPTLTELVVKNDRKRLEEFVSKYLSALAFFIIGVTGVVCLYSREIVDVLFGHGKFSAESVQITSNVLMLYGLGLMGMCFNTIVSDILYIYKHAQLLLAATIVNLLSNVILNSAFIKQYGVSGLSLATSVSIYISLALKIIFANKFVKIKVDVYRNIAKLIVSIIFSVPLSVALSNRLPYAFLKLALGGTSLLVLYSIFVLLSERSYRAMLNDFLNKRSKISGGGGRPLTESLWTSIRIDRKTNSTRSFIVLLFYRLTRYAYVSKRIGIRLFIFSMMKSVVYFFLRINAQIPYRAIIGDDIRLPHSAEGVVISSKAVIHNHITIYHQVTIGINENKPVDTQKIVIHDNCYLSAGCKVISSEVGAGSKIGPNAVVYHDLPENSVYVSSNLMIHPEKEDLGACPKKRVK